MESFDWVHNLVFGALSEGQIEALENTLDQADENVDAAILRVRQELPAGGSQADVEQLYARIQEVRRSRVIAETFRGLREAIRDAGKL